MARRAWGRPGLALAISAAVITAASLPSSSLAGIEAPQVSLKVSKHESGPYEVGQSISLEGEARNLFWRVRNVTDRRRLKGVDITDFPTTYPAGWVAKWFKGKKNITADVHTGVGYVFALRGHKPKTFRQRLKAPKPAGPLCVDVLAAGPNASSDRSVVSVNDAVCVL